MSVYPYKLEPLYKDKIWGGRSLERMFGRSLPAGNTGEAWELADLEEGECRIANGRRKGQSLRQVVAEEGAALLGATPLLPNGRFPLLLKLLDAQETLSLQVHPDERAAREIPGAALKTECWYVLESRGGFIYKGVKPGVTAEAFRAALERDDVVDLLARYDVRPGDFHWLPAGTVHALGAGVVIAEVQTPSDTTYRVSDWGRGREIHVERAMQCIHFRPADDAAPGAGGDALVKSPYFSVFRRTAKPGTRGLPEGGCVAWMVLEGEGVIRSNTPDGRLEYRPGDTLLLPAAAREITLTAHRATRYLEITLPEGK